jgi:hypothetical protein
VFQLPWLLSVTQERVFYSLLTDPPRVVVYDTESAIDGKKLSGYAPLLLQYVQTFYRPTENLGQYVIYSRNSK